jgi:hypothetical protein
MKRRFRLGIALGALLLHLLAPVAAYALVPAVAGFSDYCSVSGKRAPIPGTASGAPLSQSGSHLLSHCALCLGQAVAMVLPAAVMPLPLRVAAGVFATSNPPLVATPATGLFPPPRGPPSLPVSA